MRRFAALAFLVLLTACEPADGPYVEISGGGFQFNYRVAEAIYTLVASARRTVPEGTVFVAEFDNPAGNAPVTTELVSRPRQKQFSLHSPPVQGIRADTPYKVTLTLKTPDGAVIETHEKTYTSQIGTDMMPEKPLTIGPGYTKNPQSE